jgi:hypothetical protein
LKRRGEGAKDVRHRIRDTLAEDEHCYRDQNEHDRVLDGGDSLLQRIRNHTVVISFFDDFEVDSSHVKTGINRRAKQAEKTPPSRMSDFQPSLANPYAMLSLTSGYRRR